MPEDVAVQAETPQPTIAEGYIERTSDASGLAESSKRKPREAAPEPEERQPHRAKTQASQSLSDAFDGAAPPEAEEFELPRSMTAWRCVSAGTGGMSKRAA